MTFQNTVNIAANILPLTFYHGEFKYLRIASATLPFQISFDGQNWINAQQNSKWGPITGKNVYVRSQGQASTVIYNYGDDDFTAQDTSTSVIATSALGNGGVGGLNSYPKALNLGGVANTAWAIASIYPVDLTAGGVPANAAFHIAGVQGGHKRKQITFCMAVSGVQDVVILDSTGCVFLYIPKTSLTPFTYETSADFWVCGVGAAANNCFFYNELYYSTNA